MLVSMLVAAVLAADPCAPVVDRTALAQGLGAAVPLDAARDRRLAVWSNSRVPPRGSAIDASTNRSRAAAALLAVCCCVLQGPDEQVPPRSQVASLTVSPADAVVVEAGGAQQFSAVVGGSGGVVPQAVIWSVRQEKPSDYPWRPAGEVDATGRYRVLSPPETDARDYLRATSVADPSVYAEVAVDVPAVSMSVAPSFADLTLGNTLSFSATMRGFAVKDVLWSCRYGTVDANGKYVQELPVNAYDYVVARPAAAPDFAAAYGTVRLHLTPPVLTGTSGSLTPGSYVLIYGSGFLPNTAARYQVVLEDATGHLAGEVAYAVEDHLVFQVRPGSWNGRIFVTVWADTSPDPFGTVQSNVLVVPPS